MTVSESAEDAGCSFCGTPGADGGPLVQGGGETVGGLPTVHICLACAEASVAALADDARVNEARASQRPPPSGDAGDDHLGEICEWSTFTMDGEEWRWRASRHVSMSSARVVQLSVRPVGTAETASVILDREIETSEDVALEVARMAPIAIPPEVETRLDEKLRPLGLIQDWTEHVAGDHPIEWRTERVVERRAKVEVSVHVVHARTGKSIGMSFHKDVRPTVEHAMMAATLCDVGGPNTTRGSGDDAPPDSR